MTLDNIAVSIKKQIPVRQIVEKWREPMLDKAVKSVYNGRQIFLPQCIKI